MRTVNDCKMHNRKHWYLGLCHALMRADVVVVFYVLCRSAGLGRSDAHKFYLTALCWPLEMAWARWAWDGRKDFGNFFSLNLVKVADCTEFALIAPEHFRAIKFKSGVCAQWRIWANLFSIRRALLISQNREILSHRVTRKSVKFHNLQVTRKSC